MCYSLCCYALRFKDKVSFTRISQFRNESYHKLSLQAIRDMQYKNPQDCLDSFQTMKCRMEEGRGKSKQMSISRALKDVQSLLSKIRNEAFQHEKSTG